MYLDISVLHKKGRPYQRLLLRESYREHGDVRKRTIANLSACSEKEIGAIKLALRHKPDLSALRSVSEALTLRQGASVGAVWLVYKIASRLGISAALGHSRQGKLALWQVIARVIDQGSRLSAVRFAANPGAGDVLALDPFQEDHLYANLDWLQENQEDLENTLADQRHGKTPIELVLSEVTSSYLEGDKNERAALGYHRDQKRGKQQIVIGLLGDAAGTPLSIEIFPGNLHRDETVRLILRRNPVRAEEIQHARRSKYQALRTLIEKKNRYLQDPPRAQVAVAERTIKAKRNQLKIEQWAVVALTERSINLAKDTEQLQDLEKRDGCYVLKTDLPADKAPKDVIHDRYKDLARVEWAFRTSKTAALEMRPIHVRLESRTRGHALVVMLAYWLVKELACLWVDLDVTVEEGLNELDALCSTEISMAEGGCFHRIPEPRKLSQLLLAAATVKLPTALPSKGINVVTKKKLRSRRKAA